MKALLLSQGSAINTPLIFESHFDVKLKKARVAYIPNAKDGLQDNLRNKYLTSSIESLKSRVKYVDVVDLYKNKMTDEEWIDRYDVIWVSGGMMGSLLKAVMETDFNSQLLRLCDQGMLYVGSSAGSMLFSKTMKVAGWYPNEEEPEVALKSGLGLIPFEMFPHYNEFEHLNLIKEKTNEPIILLPDNSAIGIESSEVRFYNQARLLLYRQPVSVE